MANNKVQLSDGTVLVDMTDATATANEILSGYSAYGANGQKILGTASSGSDNPFFNVAGDINMQTMQVSNMSETFSDAMAAHSDGKVVRLTLSFIDGLSDEHTDIIGEAAMIAETVIYFYLPVVVNFGFGLTPYLIRAEWNATGMTITPYPLAVQS